VLLATARGVGVWNRALNLVPRASIVSKLPYLRHPHRSERVMAEAELKRQVAAEAMLRDRRTLKGVKPKRRPSGQEQRGRFLVRWTPGVRALAGINATLLAWLATARMLTETSVAPVGRSLMTFDP